MCDRFYYQALTSMGIYPSLSEVRAEPDLALDWQDKAESMKKAGFNKFATTLNKIATACNPKV